MFDMNQTKVTIFNFWSQISRLCYKYAVFLCVFKCQSSNIQLLIKPNLETTLVPDAFSFTLFHVVTCCVITLLITGLCVFLSIAYFRRCVNVQIFKER